MAKLNLNMILNLRDNATKKLRTFQKQLDKVNQSLAKQKSLSSSINKSGSKGSGGDGGLGTVASSLAGGGLVAGGAALSSILTRVAINIEQVAASAQYLAYTISSLISEWDAVGGISSTVGHIQKENAAIFEMLAETVDDATNELQQFNKEAQKSEQATGKLDKGGRRLASTLGGFMRMLAPLIAGFGIVSIIKVGAEFESLRAKLASVIPVGDDVSAAFALIKDIASKLPTTVQETTEAFVRMNALGITPTRERMIAFGNVAAAMGKSIIQFTEAVADASVNEFERLKEFGIKASTEGDKVTFRFKGQSKTIGNNATEIVNYLEQIGRVEFGDAAARQMDTLNGKSSNLKDAIAQLQDSIAQGGVNDAVKKLVVVLIDAVTWFNENYNAVRRFGMALTGELAAGFIHAKYAVIEFATFFTGLYQSMVDDMSAFFSNTERRWIQFKNLFGAGLVVPEEVVNNTDALAVSLDGVTKAREEELRVHRMAMDLWNEDIPLTTDAAKAADDYNKVLTDRAKAEDAANKKRVATEKAQKELNDLMEEGKQIFEDTRTPTEVLANRLVYLQKLLDAGAITWDTYARASMAAQDAHDELIEKVEGSGKTFSEFAAEAARGIQQNFSDFFFDAMNGQFDNLATMFKQTIDRMVADLLSSKLAEFLFGNYGTTNQIGGFIGGLAARADGGPVSGGTPYLVGERGPEIFQPKTNGEIIPNGAGGSTVNLNISAIDAPGVKSFFDNNRRYLTELVGGTAQTFNMRAV